MPFFDIKATNTSKNAYLEIEYNIIIEDEEPTVSVYSQLKISPNPFENTFTISGGDYINIRLLDVTGVSYPVRIRKEGANTKVMLSQEVNAGVYFVQLETSEGVVTKKILKL